MYIQINDEKYECKATVFTTQFGQEAVRVISDAPIAENGFLLLNSKDEVIADRSDFTYLYRTEGDTIKEYTAEEEEIVAAEGYEGDIPVSPISRQISSLNSRVNAITPYVESKTAYIDDEEVRFRVGKDGNISVFMVDNEGRNVPFEYDVENGEIVVRFGKRESLATVTVSIQ